MWKHDSQFLLHCDFFFFKGSHLFFLLLLQSDFEGIILQPSHKKRVLSYRAAAVLKWC